MFLLYLRRELFNRKRQTLVVSLGLGLAIALVVVVSALSAGVDEAQSQVLGSLYGLGTDISVTKSPQPGQGGGGPQRFGVDGGDSAGQARQFSRTQVRLNRGSRTFTPDEVASVGALSGVDNVATSLRLTSLTFDGELPDVSQLPQPGQGPQGAPFGRDGQGDQAGQGDQGGRGQGGFRTGNANFSVTTFGLMGVDLADPGHGPLSSTKVTDGRALGIEDAGQDVVVVDDGYAASESLAVGGTITIAERPFTIVGLVGSATEAAETATDVYLPLDVAQALAGQAGTVTNLYLSTVSGDQTNTVAESVQQTLPDATVSTSSDLGASVSGSLTTASDLLGKLGRWLSILVLAAAFLAAILFTTSGVSRRTREFGTLRALGWKKGRIVGQVAGESVVQGLLGGAVGVLIGLVGVGIVGAIAPSLEASTLSTDGGPGGFPGGPPGAGGIGGAGGGAGSGRGGFPGTTIPGGRGGFGGQTANTFEVVLHGVVTPSVIITAIALALLGGLLAGAFGGLRASRLRPADALRSVA